MNTNELQDTFDFGHKKIKPSSDEEGRFIKKVAKRPPNECWPWKGARGDDGYGLFWSMGENVYAHRVAWVIANKRDITDGLLVCHTCDNPPCCNPAHLFLGTHKDNADDMVAKGRSAKGKHGYFNHPESVRGCANVKAKLDESKIKAIRIKRANGCRPTDLAKEYGVTDATIAKIVLRQSWAHVL